MLSKTASSAIFWVFDITRPGIEPWPPGPLANTLLISPIADNSFFISFYTAIYFHSTRVFHKRPSDNKSHQVSKTLVSILVDFKSVVVGMVSSLLPNVSSPNLFSSSLRNCSKSTNKKWYRCYLNVPQLFSGLWQDPGIFYIFTFF